MQTGGRLGLVGGCRIADGGETEQFFTDISALSSGVLQVAVSNGVVTPSTFAATATRIPFGSGTNGGLTDSADLTWNNTTKKLVAAGSGAGVTPSIAISTATANENVYSEVGAAAGTGDPTFRLTIASGTSWFVGVDNSASDVFVIGTGTDAATNVVQISTAGQVAIGGNAPGDDLDVQKSSAGSIGIRVRNFGAGSAIITTSVQSSGDAFHVATVSTGQTWAWGIDNSVSSPEADPFVLARASVLGNSTDVLRVFSDRLQFNLGAAAPGEGRWVRRAHVQTTNATPTTIATLAIGTGKTHTFRVTVASGKSDSTSGAGYERFVTYKNNAGTVTIVGTATLAHTAEDAAGQDVTFAISGTNVNVQVTGVAATTIEWECVVEEVVTAVA